MWFGRSGATAREASSLDKVATRTRSRSRQSDGESRVCSHLTHLASGRTVWRNAPRPVFSKMTALLLLLTAPKPGANPRRLRAVAKTEAASQCAGSSMARWRCASAARPAAEAAAGGPPAALLECFDGSKGGSCLSFAASVVGGMFSRGHR